MPGVSNLKKVKGKVIFILSRYTSYKKHKLSIKALDRVDLWLKVPSGTLESSKEIEISFFPALTGNGTRVVRATSKCANHLTNMLLLV